MMSFRHERLQQEKLHTSTVWLLGEVAEFKGMQELYTRQSPQVLKALKEHAMVQSAESSNRIEGVTVARDRLAPLVLRKVKPKDRSEEEIQQYRNALNLIHTQAADLTISTKTLLLLHNTIQFGAGDAGQLKAHDNDIIEIVPGAAPRVRFQPTPAKQTAQALEELCGNYNMLSEQSRLPALVGVLAFVLDFLCIHPFRDGNGRVSRLLTLLLLYKSGYEVGRYISLERLIEESKEDYYEALQRSSSGWHEGNHELSPWLNQSLGIIRRAYAELENRVNDVHTARGGKRALVEDAISAFVGEFTFSDLQRVCPGVSDEMIKIVMRELKLAGKLVTSGRGKAARWSNKGNNS
jgi:Fic family protein